MEDTIKKTVSLIGGPARFARKKVTGWHPIWWACWGVFWILVVWDVYLALDPIDGNTWSEVMREASTLNPLFPWLLGVLLAHLFHFRDDLKPIFDRDAASTLMVAITIGLGVIGIYGVELTGWSMTLLVILGMVTALLFWPMHRQGQWHW